MPRRLRAAALGLVAGLGVLVVGAAAADPRPLTVDDILRLHAAGVDEDIIISEIVVTDTVFLLDVADILRLSEAGLSDRLLQFMVDTGREDVVTDTGTDAGTEADAPADDGEPEVAYVEETVSRPVYVSLRWSYPVWWYDYYWHDYWYYDCGYDPWLVSWTVPCGVWYPTWYWSSRCWAPPGWGYRYHWWSSCGYPGYAWHDGYTSYWDRWGSGAHALSQRKSKSGGSSAGKLVVAGAGLRTREGARLPDDRSVRVASRKGRLVADSHDLDVRRPTRTGAKAPADRGDAIRRPVKSNVRVDPDRVDVRRPARPVRNPAPADRPVKHVIRRTQGNAPTKSPGDRAPRAPSAEKPAPARDGGTKVRPPAAPKPEPAPRPEPPPRVESRPAPKAAPAPAPPSSGKGSRGDGGGSRSGSGKARGR